MLPDDDAEQRNRWWWPVDVEFGGHTYQVPNFVELDPSAMSIDILTTFDRLVELSKTDDQAMHFMNTAAFNTQKTGGKTTILPDGTIAPFELTVTKNDEREKSYYNSINRVVNVENTDSLRYGFHNPEDDQYHRQPTELIFAHEYVHASDLFLNRALNYVDGVMAEQYPGILKMYVSFASMELAEFREIYPPDNVLFKGILGNYDRSPGALEAMHSVSRDAFVTFVSAGQQRLEQALANPELVALLNEMARTSPDKMDALLARQPEELTEALDTYLYWASLTAEFPDGIFEVSPLMQHYQDIVTGSSALNYFEKLYVAEGKGTYFEWGNPMGAAILLMREQYAVEMTNQLGEKLFPGGGVERGFYHDNCEVPQGPQYEGLPTITELVGWPNEQPAAATLDNSYVDMDAWTTLSGNLASVEIAEDPYSLATSRAPLPMVVAEGTVTCSRK